MYGTESLCGSSVSDCQIYDFDNLVYLITDAKGGTRCWHVGKSLYHVTNLLEIKILAFTYVYVLLTIVEMNFLI